MPLQNEANAAKHYTTTPQNTTHTDFEGLDSGVIIMTKGKTIELDMFDEELMQWMGIDENDEIHLLQLGDEWQFA